jgi:hypothetical protein
MNNSSAHIPKWVYVAYVAMWILLLASFVDYYIRFQRINPLGVLLLIVLLVGSFITPRWLKQPLFTREGMQERLILMAFLLGMLVGFAFTILVVARTCL